MLVQPSVYGADNAAMLDALRSGGAGFRAVAVTIAEHFGKRNQVAASRRRARAALQRGRPCATNKNRIPADMLRGVAKRIAPHGWHIEMLVNLDEAGDFAPLLGSLGVPVVLGHLGYPKGGAATWTRTRAFADLLRLLDGGQCWIKLTGPYRITTAPDLPYADVDEPARKLVAAAPERMLWGTDWPHVMKKKPMRNDGDMADLLERWVPDAASAQAHPGGQSGGALRLRGGREDRVLIRWLPVLSCRPARQEGLRHDRALEASSTSASRSATSRQAASSTPRSSG